jgi:hypothetical protein
MALLIVTNNLNEAVYLWKRTSNNIKRTDRIFNTLWEIANKYMKLAFHEAHELESNTQWTDPVAGIIASTRHAQLAHHVNILAASITDMTLSQMQTYFQLQSLEECLNGI